jgi:hypothetical protein
MFIFRVYEKCMWDSRILKTNINFKKRTCLWYVGHLVQAKKKMWNIIKYINFSVSINPSTNTSPH